MENGTKQQAYQRPEAEAIKLRNGLNLLINFSATEASVSGKKTNSPTSKLGQPEFS